MRTRIGAVVAGLLAFSLIACDTSSTPPSTSRPTSTTPPSPSKPENASAQTVELGKTLTLKGGGRDVSLTLARNDDPSVVVEGDTFIVNLTASVTAGSWTFQPDLLQYYTSRDPVKNPVGSFRRQVTGPVLVTAGQKREWALTYSVPAGPNGDLVFTIHDESGVALGSWIATG
jgi:hypothetical protein